MSGTTDQTDTGPARRILEKHGALRQGLPTGPDRERLAEFLIPVLQDIQEEYGYLPRPVLQWLNGQTGIPLPRMYGVITFYTQFHLEPRGEHTVKCCTGTACHVKGGKAVAEAIADHLDVPDGGTTADLRFTFETVQCLGTCFLAPVVMVDDDYHGEVTQDRVRKILKRYS